MEKSGGNVEAAQHETIDLAVAPMDELRGRATQQQEHNRTYWQTLRRDPWLLFWIGAMLWTLIVRGFENQSSGSVISIPYFQREFGHPEPSQPGSYYVSTQWQSALSGGSNAFAILGAIAGSLLADHFGVKWVLLGFAALNIVAVGVEFSSTSIEIYFGGKMLNFIAIGAFQNLCTAYVADVSPLAIRASTVGFCNLSQCIGPFTSAIMSNFTETWDTRWSWQSLIAAQWGFGGTAFILIMFMPESPIYLVRKNRLDAAEKVVKRLYSDPAEAMGHLEVFKLTIDESEVQKEASYLDCFRGTNARRTWIAIFVFLSEPMSGLGFVSNYGALMYEFLKISPQESFHIQIGAQILSMSGAFIALLVGDFIGRRVMFLTGCVGLTALLFCMGISGSFNTTAGVTASVGFYTMFNFFYNVGVGSIVYAIAGEISSYSLRQKTLALAISVSAAANTFWSFVAPYMFNPGYGDLKARIGFVFGACMLIFFLVGFFIVPETRRRSYEELDEMFMAKVPARKFKLYRTTAEQRAARALSIVEEKAID